jgi:hypothetical protein
LPGMNSLVLLLAAVGTTLPCLLLTAAGARR